MFAVIINIVFAIAAAVGTVALGLAFRQIGTLKLSWEYARLIITNYWFILSLVLGFGSVFLRYAILKVQGVAQSSFYLQTSLLAVAVLSSIVLGERLTAKGWAGAGLIMAGAFLIGAR